jgi:hypothetical protein
MMKAVATKAAMIRTTTAITHSRYNHTFNLAYLALVLV